MQTMEVSTWADFETLVTAKKLPLQYTETPTLYEVYAPEKNIFMWHTTLLKGTADATDFEDNHKTAANGPLEIKAGIGRPPRVCVSPQPDSTYWMTKGYVIECGSGDSSKDIDITFDTKVYLLGGEIKSADVVAGDKFKAEVQMQIAGNWTTIMTPMSDIYMLPNMKEIVKSDECMEFPTIYRLKITFTPASTGTAKKLYVKLEYFK